MTETDIAYHDVETLKSVLVGRKIVSVQDGFKPEPTWYSRKLRQLSYTLDDGTVLKATESDGGCSCANGCFSVAPGDGEEALDRAIGATILNVEVEELAKDWEADHPVHALIEPGSISSGDATIRLFVYTELGKATLVESEGSDNGWYGWGFWMSVDRPETAETAEAVS